MQTHYQVLGCCSTTSAHDFPAMVTNYDFAAHARTSGRNANVSTIGCKHLSSRAPPGIGAMVAKRPSLTYRRLHTLSTHLHTFDRTRTLSWSSQSLVAFHRITRKVSSSMQRMQCTRINDRHLSLTHDNTWHNVSDRNVTIEGNGVEGKWKQFTSATKHSLANTCSLMSMQLRQKEYQSCQHPQI